MRLIGLGVAAGLMLVVACTGSGADPSPVPIRPAPTAVAVDPTPVPVQPVDGRDIPKLLPAELAELIPNMPRKVDPRRFSQLLPRDRILPIYNPGILSPDEAQLDAQDMVIGVSIGGESRAYPIRTLRFREMVDDELGGIPILVTW